MRSVAGALAIGAAVALCAMPTWAQEEESAAPAPANHETAKPARSKEPAEPVREAAEPAPAAAEESAGEPSNEVAPAKKRVRRRRARVVPAGADQPAARPEPAPVEAKPAALPTEEKPTALPAAALPAEVKVAAPIDTLPIALPAAAVPAAAAEEKPVPASPEPMVVPAHHAEAEPGVAHEAEHGEHAAFSVKTFVLQLINFGVLLFLLIYFGGRELNKWLRARHEQLKGDINESTRLRDEAKQKFDAQERRVAELEKEIAALRESMRQDAAHEQARMLEAAQERGKQMQKEMRTQIDEQVKVAEAQLRAEVANASVKSAEELVRKAVNFDDERRLAREFVAGFDEPSGPGGEVS
jgi:F0F1-type ATP synthase membrane subunit b/b'